MFFSSLIPVRMSAAAMLLGVAVLDIVANADETSPTAVSIVDVVLLAGQSNADGRAHSSGLPPELRRELPEVMLHAHTFGAPPNPDGSLGKLGPLAPGRTQFPAEGFGPEVSLGHALAAHYAKIPGRAVAIIKYAKGGSSLYKDWRPGGDAAAESYAANLATFVADVRQTFMSPALPFLFNRLSANQHALSTPSSKDYPRYLALREKQNEAASKIAKVTIFDNDGPDFTFLPDQVHYSAAGQMALGKSFGTTLIARIPNP